MLFTTQNKNTTITFAAIITNKVALKITYVINNINRQFKLTHLQITTQNYTAMQLI